MGEFTGPGDVFLADCSARLAVEIIGDKWAIVVLYGLSRGPRRHGELLALVGGISKKVLTQTLRRLERHGLVRREAYPGVPPRVEYALTDLGRTLMEPVAALTSWAEHYGSGVLEAHEGARTSRRGRAEASTWEPIGSHGRVSVCRSMQRRRHMKAIAISEVGGPERLELMHVPVPVPAPDEVLVRVEAAGVNEVDTLLREGYFDTGARPLVMGSDFSGVIEVVGDDVRDLAVGDEVYGYKLLGNGTYAEFVAVPAAWARTGRRRSHTRRQHGRCVGLTAYQGLVETLDPAPGETVVITGAAGGVGSVAVQLAATRGAHVIATASVRNREYLESLGAKTVVDSTAGDWVEAVRALHPDGADAVLTCRGGETKRRAPEVLRDRGRLVWMTGDDQAGPPMERGIAGSYVGGTPSRATLEALADEVDSGGLRPTVRDVYPLTEARAAQIRVAEGHVRGKLVIAVGSVPYHPARSSVDQRARAGPTRTGS